MKKYNTNPIPARIGIAMFLLAMFLGLVFMNTPNQYIFIFLFVLMIAGLMLASYGLIKTEVKGDKSYQNFLRMLAKISIVFIPLVSILGILGILSVIPIEIILTFLMVLLFAYPILVWVFYIKTFLHIRKTFPKLSYHEKRKQIIYLIIVIVLGLALWYVLNFVILKKS